MLEINFAQQLRLWFISLAEMSDRARRVCLTYTRILPTPVEDLGWDATVISLQNHAF